MKLKNQVAVITGAGSGIGRAIAVRFAAEGAHVVASGRSPATLAKTVSIASVSGTKCVAVPADVSKSDDVQSLFAEIDRQFGNPDILVNNAGIGIADLERFNRTAETRGKEFAEAGRIATHWDITRDMSDDTWREMLAIHLDGTFFCTREALKLMGRANRGSIVNIASTAGLTGQEGAPHYSAAKAGIIGFTQSVAREVASQNIRVNALCPGFVTTAMSDGYSARFKQGTLGRIPLGRWGMAEEVAAAALFLATDDASYMTGQCLSPNGGIFMS
jgi:NAD(P)-dependent dehydrogenase (short-subunit alcohol dehydrogenase family)